MATHTHVELLDLLRSDWRPTGGVVEIGSQREKGRGSSWELMRLAQKLDLPFVTVDMNPKTTEMAKDAVGNRAVTAEGASYIRQYAQPISILYLDNFDIINGPEHQISIKRRSGDFYKEFGYSMDDAIEHNLQSNLVHLEQAKAALPFLTEQCVVAFDDTKLRRSGPGTYWQGKGGLGVPYMLHAGFEIALRGDKGVVLTRGLAPWAQLVKAKRTPKPAAAPAPAATPAA